jgi:hypothetical protein
MDYHQISLPKRIKKIYKLSSGSARASACENGLFFSTKKDRGKKGEKQGEK